MIYFDNSSTTKPCEQAISAASKALREMWGNPSSLHKMGIESERLIMNAREVIAGSINAEEGEIFFTSGATESNNTAIFSSALTKGKRRKKIITTATEHPSVSAPIKRLEDQGFEVVRIFPGEDGVIDPYEVVKQVDKNTLLVSMIMVNNETGVINDVSTIFKAVKAIDKEVYTHTDAVQGFLKIHVNAKKLCADMISLSGHKVYAPKGVGAIYIKKGLNLKPFIVGGGQEKGIRSGTESVPLICAFAETVKVHSKTQDERYKKAALLRQRLMERTMTLDGVYLHEFKSFLPYINSLTVKGYKSETLLHFLEEREIYVSSGSACSKGKKSEVLKAFGYSDSELDSTLRISFCGDNTEDDVDRLAYEIQNAMNSLVKIKR